MTIKDLDKNYELQKSYRHLFLKLMKKEYILINV